MSVIKPAFSATRIIPSQNAMIPISENETFIARLHPSSMLVVRASVVLFIKLNIIDTDISAIKI
jgi:hypothetical protein